MDSVRCRDDASDDVLPACKHADTASSHSAVLRVKLSSLLIAAAAVAAVAAAVVVPDNSENDGIQASGIIGAQTAGWNSRGTLPANRGP